MATGAMEEKKASLEENDEKTGDGITELAQKINSEKMKAMKERLSKMSPEELRKRMEQAKERLQNLSPEQRLKMQELAKQNAKDIKLPEELIETKATSSTVKPTDVAVGVEEMSHVLHNATVDENLPSIVPAAVEEEEKDVETLYKEYTDLPMGAGRESFLSTLAEDKRKMLIEYTKNTDPSLHLLNLACKGDLCGVKKAIEDGADVNYVDGTDSVLMMACWFGKEKVVDYLLSNNADVRHKNENKQTAIHYAAMKGYIQIIKKLNARGVDLEALDDKGYTPVICAAQFGHTALLDYFKRKGASIFKIDLEGHTILHWTAYNSHPLTTDWILNEGVDIQVKDKKGRTALHWAAKQGNKDILKILVEFIDDEGFLGLLYEKDEEGNTPLDLARYYENHGAVSYLKEVIRRQKGCMSVWNRVTCQSGIRPGAGMRSTARAVSSYLIIVMFVTLLHAFFVIMPYSPTISESSVLALFVMGFLCYFFWFASHLQDPGYIEPAPGSTTYRKIMKGKTTKPKRTRNGYIQTANETDSQAGFEDIEMKLYDEDEELKEEVKDEKVVDSKDKYPEDAPYWTLPYEVLLERGRWDAICVTCGIVKPLRSKHCKQTGRCVARFDHYCPWISNVVAENNRRSFLLLAVIQTLSTWFYVVLCGIHLTHHSCSDSLAYTLGIPLMVQAMIVGTWGIALAQEHVRLAMTNITTNEKMNQHRYSYMRDENGAPKNPFDQGTVQNLLYFFGAKAAPDWRELNINTKFLPPGKKGCCPSHQHAGASFVNVDESSNTNREEAKRVAEDDSSREAQGLLASQRDLEEDLEVGAGVGF
mmetsp:Transcript_9053/g.13569  ORF Transcript_9053/g.13569 Transcript_9053/m.13569 type:complete len:818 (-) Transcript_9053:292-2745(-)